MATDRPRIQAYVEPAIHDSFLKWKQERGIAKDSEALNQLLAEYFGVSSQSPIPNPQFSMEEIHELIALKVAAQLAREENHSKFEEINTDVTNLGMHLESIEARFIQFQEKISFLLGAKIASELPRELPSESLQEKDGDLESPPKDEAPGLEEAKSLSADAEGDTADELVRESPSKLPSELTASELAKRLGVNKSWVSRHKTDISFEGDTREKDPEAIAWRYDRKKQRFFPVGGA